MNVNQLDKFKQMQGLLILISLLVCFFLASTSVYADPLKETLKNGSHHLKHRKYHRVITEAAKINLNNLPKAEKLTVALLQGQAFLGLKRFQHAQKAFETALTCDDCDIHALLGLTWSKLLAKDIQGAELTLMKAASHAPNDTEVLAVQGKVASMRGDLVGAARYYQRAIHADKTNKKARFGLAAVLMQEKLLDPHSEVGSILLSTEAY